MVVQYIFVAVVIYWTIESCIKTPYWRNLQVINVVEIFEIRLNFLNIVCCVGRVEIQIEIQKGRLIYYFHFLFLSDEGKMLETLDYIIRIGSSRAFLYFDEYRSDGVIDELVSGMIG